MKFQRKRKTSLLFLLSRAVYDRREALDCLFCQLICLAWQESSAQAWTKSTIEVQYGHRFKVNSHLVYKLLKIVMMFIPLEIEIAKIGYLRATNKCESI